MHGQISQQLSIALQLSVAFRHDRIEPLQLAKAQRRLDVGDPIVEAQVLLLIDTYRDLLLGCELFRLLDNQTVVRLLERLEPCTFLPNQVIR